jgi:hypothetical protein
MNCAIPRQKPSSISLSPTNCSDVYLSFWTGSKRIWTKFESEQFKQRFGDGSVIPIWFADTPVGMFDETARVGGMTFDREVDLDTQIEEFATLALMKLAEDRAENIPIAIQQPALKFTDQ